MLASTQELITELKEGRMIILVDEEDRENEGDLVLAADFVTPEAINFMAMHARGLVCLTLTGERCRQLRLPLMTQANGTPYGTAFTISIEAAEGVTTGISAADRARTVRAAVARDAKPSDLVQPGHIFPVMAQEGGVLVRAGHTEAGCELTAMAGLTPAAVICEVIKDDGEMARLPDLLEFGARHGLKTGTIADLIDYRLRHESIVERVRERPMQTPYGAFHSVLFRDRPTGMPHLALIKGTPRPDVETWVRVHEPVSMLDLLDVGASAHSWPLDAALREIGAAQSGVVVLLNCAESTERFCETFAALDDPETAGRLQRRPVDFKTYGVGAQILRELGVGKMRVLSAPRKLTSMSGYGLEATSFLPGPGAQPESAH
ncbi:bifunctional 3,4-dihydroxy-2-butanone-4-phosphate synthase/GTP cyclohydrolase II [Chitinasiproducens palmae]|uniref:3,4-dihydroxy-2-butanone 4-phosphate synthase n=1 Tax=Chitinasiproducens palmae TaxID=1770053 RepID=A0A1H2PME2_9BURK|nr:bifunctional 3,4-dihydroxy-2-butanone-4-phosphate synthase/GTP cyclohydrolase II [Chitinasiproducens palmae]SDV47755.1 GTP cyclohydrolase II /3,4-dihydroxy-2-butanone 4-phosphate synthase [Chitinasiproducens palmae]